MLPVGPVEDVEDLVVDARGDGEADDGQREGGDHGDDAELEQGQQSHHQARQHHGRTLRVLPVDQIHHWGDERAVKTGASQADRHGETERDTDT